MTIESTDKTTRIDNVPVRVWEGVTESGIRCELFVHRVAVAPDADATEFERELQEKLPPGRYIPLSLIL